MTYRLQSDGSGPIFKLSILCTSKHSNSASSTWHTMYGLSTLYYCTPPCMLGNLHPLSVCVSKSHHILRLVREIIRKMLSSSGASLCSWHQLYSSFNITHDVATIHTDLISEFSPTIHCPTGGLWHDLALLWYTKKPNTQNNQDRGS